MCISCKLNSFYRKNHQFLLQRYLKLPLLLHSSLSFPLSPIHTHTHTRSRKSSTTITHIYTQTHIQELHKVLHTLKRANCCELCKEMVEKNKQKKRAGIFQNSLAMPLAPRPPRLSLPCLHVHIKHILLSHAHDDTLEHRQAYTGTHTLTVDTWLRQTFFEVASFRRVGHFVATLRV